MTNLSVRYTIVPWIAPASPAFVVGVEFFRDLAYSQDWNLFLAGVAAFTLALTIELGGAFAAMGLTIFWQKQNWSRVMIALLALVGYSYFGISLTWGTQLWPIFLFVSILYLTIASLDTHKMQQQEVVSEKQLDLQIEKQKASTARARAREAQFSGFETKNSVKNLKVNERVKIYLDNLESPENAKVQEISDNANVSIGTASEHKRRYLFLKATTSTTIPTTMEKLND